VAPESKGYFLENSKLFMHISKKEQRWLIRHASKVTFKKGEIIFRESMPLNYAKFVMDGMVKVSRRGSGGKSIILKVLGPDSFIDLMSLLEGAFFEYTATAVTRASIGLIRLDVFRDMVESNYALGTSLLKQSMNENRYLLNKLMARNVKRLPGRVADVILYFYEFYGQECTFHFPLSRHELAQLASTTKESFIRTLSEFKHDKIILLDDRAITINSMEILRTLSRLG